MAKDSVCVIEIGSCKLQGMIAQQGVNGTFNIKANSKVDYAGFFEGEFLDKNALEDAVQALFADLSQEYRKKIDKVYVGVPAEFSKVFLTKVSLSFRSRKTIKENTLTALKNMAMQEATHRTMEVLSASPIEFVLDDDRKVFDPIGHKASKITAEMSVVLMQSEFVNTFNSLWQEQGLSQVVYLSEPLCQSLFVLDEDMRERTCIVIDVGARSTSVSFVKGGGLENLTSFSMGGSHVTNDLSDAFSLSYTDAHNLKKEIVLSLKGAHNDFYELMTYSGKVAKVPMNLANEAVAYRLSLIASAVNECIRLFAKEYVPYYPVYLCGNGLCKITGGKDFFAKSIGRNITTAEPPIPGMNKSGLASVLGLLNQALKD